MVIKMLFKYSIMDEIYGLKKYENEFLIYDHNSLTYFDPLVSAAICRQFVSINCRVLYTVVVGLEALLRELFHFTK